MFIIYVLVCVIHLGFTVNINTYILCILYKGFPGGSAIKNLPPVQETRVQSLGGEDPLEEGMATHSSIVAWKIAWTEEPGGLQSKGLQGVSHD